MSQLSYRRHRFPAEIIQHAIWLYLRFTLSYRDVEEMLAERGLDVSYSMTPPEKKVLEIVDGHNYERLDPWQSRHCSEQLRELVGEEFPERRRVHAGVVGHKDWIDRG